MDVAAPLPTETSIPKKRAVDVPVILYADPPALAVEPPMKLPVTI